jgi:hypothetical protein
MLRKACALTLAFKLKLRSAARVFVKFGPRLRITNKLGNVTSELSAYPTTLKTNLLFSKGGFSSANLTTSVCNQVLGLNMSYKNPLPIRGGEVCLYEGCVKTSGLASNYLNPRVSLKRKDPAAFPNSLIVNKKKQIVTCRKHQMLLHRRKSL